LQRTLQRSISLLAVACVPAVAAGQPPGNRIGIDSLQLSSLALFGGHAWPSQSESAELFGIAADYGALSRSLRLRLEGSFMESRLTDDVVRTFLDSLRKRITDPSGDDAAAVSRVTYYDVTMGLGIRYIPMQTAVLQPYAGAGIGVHVINAEGPLIDGTFVERLFDNVATGVFVESGVVFKPLRRIGVDARVRGDLVNAFRALSARVGGVYYFGPLRRPDP
jgi:hypothetical protein